MNELISKIGLDKFCHFGIGGVITAFISIVAMLQEIPFIDPWFTLVFPVMGIVVTAILEFIKEYVIDEIPDKKDILWTMGGSVTIFLGYLIGIIFNILSV